jgi:hypothetical protein
MDGEHAEVVVVGGGLAGRVATAATSWPSSTTPRIATSPDHSGTPWNGAFVVTRPRTHSTLTGYDAEDNVLGRLPISD